MTKIMSLVLLFLTVTSAHSVSNSNAKNITGIVTPIQPCGGTWFPIEVRLTNCEGAPPCTVTTFTEEVLEVGFSVQGETSLIRYILDLQTFLGNIVIADAEMEVVSSTYYNIRQEFIISNALAGQAATFFINVFDVTNSRWAFCAELPLQIAL